MANSNLLGLLLLQTGGQANAEEAVNDITETLEAFAVGLAVEDIANDEAGGETDGQAYIVGSSPTGEFAAFSEHDVALRLGGGWVAFTPSESWRATFKTAGNPLALFDGTSWVAAQDETQAVVVASPGSSEDVSVFFAEHAITVQEMNAVVRGTTPSVTWTIRHGTDRSAAGAEVATSGTTTTTQSGESVTSFNDATIVAGSWVWLETTAASGTNNELAVSVRYRRDLT